MRDAVGIGPSVPAHRTAIELRREHDDYDDAFVFTIVRNPFSRVVSQYKHRRSFVDASTFDEWVRDAYTAPYNRRRQQRHGPKLFRPQSHWITDENGVRIVDYVGRFECVDYIWWRLKERFDHLSGELPTHNRASDRTPWSAFYEHGPTAQIVRVAYADDFDRFGYPTEIPDQPNGASFD